MFVTEVHVLTQPGRPVRVDQEPRHRGLAVPWRTDDYEVPRLVDGRQRRTEHTVAAVEHVADDLVPRVGAAHAHRQVDDDLLDREPLGLRACLVKVDLAFVGERPAGVLLECRGELAVGQDTREPCEVSQDVAGLQEAVDGPPHVLVRVEKTGEVVPVEDLPLAQARHPVASGLALVPDGPLVPDVEVILGGGVAQGLQPVLDLLGHGGQPPAPRYRAEEDVRDEHQLLGHVAPLRVRRRPRREFGQD